MVVASSLKVGRVAKERTPVEVNNEISTEDLRARTKKHSSVQPVYQVRQLVETGLSWQRSDETREFSQAIEGTWKDKH